MIISLLLLVQCIHPTTNLLLTDQTFIIDKKSVRQISLFLCFLPRLSPLHLFCLLLFVFLLSSTWPTWLFWIPRLLPLRQSTPPTDLGLKTSYAFCFRPCERAALDRQSEQQQKSADALIRLRNSSQLYIIAFQRLSRLLVSNHCTIKKH